MVKGRKHRAKKRPPQRPAYVWKFKLKPFWQQRKGR